MFRGNHPTRVDEKGRLKLPAEFKRRIDEKYTGRFYITSKDGQVVKIFPMQEWEQIEQKLAKISDFDASKRKLMDFYNFYGSEAEMDAQGRLLLPQILREKANVMGDVVVFGMQTYLEVANRETFVANMSANPLTAEDEKKLAEFGL
jgi:MraZ protein